MEIDKDKVRTQDEEAEPAPIDQVEDRVEAEMKQIEARAKERVAQGLQDEELEQELALRSQQRAVDGVGRGDLLHVVGNQSLQEFPSLRSADRQHATFFQ